MKNQIIRKLAQLESKHNVRILYAVESGSRAWGFASRDSDYDVRFIYAHPLEWYLRIDATRDVIEYPLDENMLDVSGWDIKKTLRLLQKGNPPLLEWLRSPIIYMEDKKTIADLRKLAGKIFSPQTALYHYLNMANKNYRSYLKQDLVRTKKYLYVLRPLLACEWIEKNGTMAPMEFDILLEQSRANTKIKTCIEKLLIRKKAGEELDREPRIAMLNAFIEKRLEHYEKIARDAQPVDSSKQLAMLHTFFRKVVIP